MKKFGSVTQKRGRIAEDLAVSFLLRNGFSVIERNYTQKWGEIDIICQKDGIVHFVEVKSVSCESYRPEEQIHARKRARLLRTIETYLARHFVAEWCFDAVLVRLDLQRRVGRVTIMSDLILSRS